LPQLSGSFLQVVKIDGNDVWKFAHPTISDALTDILESQPHMIDALVRGATIEKVLGDFICEDAFFVTDAPIIPRALNDVLVARICSAKDQPPVNFAIFSFLDARATDDVVQKVILADPEILSREAWLTHRLARNPKLRVHARAHRLGLLGDEQREWATELMESGSRYHFDLSFMEDEEMLAIIAPNRLLEIGFRLGSDVLEQLSSKIEDAIEDADEDDPESNFEHISAGLDRIVNIGPLNERSRSLVSDARAQVADAISTLERRKEEREEDHSEEWNFMSPEPKKLSEEPVVAEPETKRSIFADVDQGEAPEPQTSHGASSI
jgi:hypothetical protein